MRFVPRSPPPQTGEQKKEEKEKKWKSSDLLATKEDEILH
jgi:hypothetical protein